MAQEAIPAKTPQPVAKKTDAGSLPPSKNSGCGIWIWLIFLLLVAGGVAWYFYGQKGKEAAAGKGKGGKHGGADTIRVVDAKATQGDMGVYLWGLGSVTPLNTVTVRSRVDGQLMKVNFTEGQTVKEGDLLAQIDDRPYKALVAQYTAQKEHDEALLENAKLDLVRYQTLWKQDSIPQQTLATQDALVKQDQGTVDSDTALIQTAQLNVDYCNITAPIGGRVGLRLVDQGNQVHASDTTGLLVITQIQPIAVVFTLPEDSIQQVLDKVRDNQTLVVEAFDRNKTKKLADGTLLTPDNQIDKTTGTLKFKAVFPNDNKELFPSQFVNARLLVEMKKDVTIVPVAAIQHGTLGTFVYVVHTADDATTVSSQTVEVGTIDAERAEITKGVSPGDDVVIDGVDKLQDGTKVIVQAPVDNSLPSVAPEHKHSGHKKDGATPAAAPANS